MTHNEIAEIFSYLRPNGGWVLSGNDIENAIYDDGVAPITKAEFDSGILSFKKEQANKITAKADLLAKLGITADEAKLLLG